jgi:hypothetical protein
VNVSELNMEIVDQGSEFTRLKVKGEATTFRFIEQQTPAPTAAPAGGAQKPGAPRAAAPAGRKS